ncbi:MAG: hypothetical protein ACRD3R_01125, partial [Terriglobales bacterium]
MMRPLRPGRFFLPASLAQAAPKGLCPPLELERLEGLTWMPPKGCATFLAPRSTMSIQLNHTIVSARDPQASAAFLAEILG